MSSDFKSFKESYDVRKQQDTYRFAKIAEHEDFKINQANCNRVMITGSLFRIDMKTESSKSISLSLFLIGLKSASYPTETRDQQAFVIKMMEPLVKKVLGRDAAFALKIWTVEHRRLARGSNEVLIPAVEMTFIEEKVGIEFRKGAATRAKSRKAGFEGIYFSMYVGLQTKIRCEVILFI